MGVGGGGGLGKMKLKLTQPKVEIEAWAEPGNNRLSCFGFFPP